MTDFDSWKEDEPPLRVEDLVRVFMENVHNVTELILSSVPRLSEKEKAACG